MEQRSRERLLWLYRKRAKHYDFTANLYYLVGFREWAYRKKAVEALDVAPGDTVVEVCCGTGLNFALLEQAVGPEGQIIGVDLTDAMLTRAKERVEQNGWTNVELVQSDAAVFDIPTNVDGIISTFALSLVPEYERVIECGSRALKPGKRWVVLDLTIPENWVSRFAPLFLFLTRPFGETMDAAARQPWVSMNRYLRDITMTKLYFGFSYIATGRRDAE